jgi:hypothetical protein
VETLVRCGSDTLDCIDDEGRTPMHYVRDAPTLEALVRCGSNAFSMKDYHGSTPLSSQMRSDAIYIVDDNLMTSFLVLEGSEDRITECNDYCNWKGIEPITWTDDDALEIRFRTYFAHSLVYRLLYLSSLAF